MSEGKSGIVPIGALVVSILALVVSCGSLCVSYLQSPLSGRFAPKLSASEYACTYRVEGGKDLRGFFHVEVTNSGEGAAKDVYLQLTKVPNESAIESEPVPFEIVKGKSELSLIHFPSIPSGIRVDVIAAGIPVANEGVGALPYAELAYSAAGPIYVDKKLQMENATLLSKALHDKWPLQEIHGNKNVEIVEEYTDFESVFRRTND